MSLGIWMRHTSYIAFLKFLLKIKFSSIIPKWGKEKKRGGGVGNSTKMEVSEKKPNFLP